MDLEGAWSIDFLLNVRSLRGRLDIDQLRQMKDLLPTQQEPIKNDPSSIGYSLEWDYAAYSDPQIHTATPYISWTDYWILKPGSKLILFGEELPIKLAVLHASTASLYLEAQKKNTTSDLIRIDALATDKSLSKNEFFFGFSKRASQSDGLDDLQKLGETLQPIRA